MSQVISVDIFFVPDLLWRQTTPRSRCHRIPRNAFWHSDPYIFLHFVGNVFCLVSVKFFLVTYVLWRQTTPRSHCQRRTQVNSTRFSLFINVKHQPVTSDSNVYMTHSLRLAPRCFMHLPSITESVDSLCRDGTDTPYSVIETKASKNLLTTNLPQSISIHRHLTIIFGCSATNKSVKLANKHRWCT